MLIHFAPDGEDAACGVRTYLCDEVTDEPEYVECKRCRRTKAFIDYDPRRFDVDVWNHEGDVIDWSRRCDIGEVERFQSIYAADPAVSVVVSEI